MLDKLFNRVYRLVRYRAYWVLGLFFVLAALSLFYVFPFPIRSSLLDLLPSDDPLIEEYRRREESVDSTQQLTVVLSYEEEVLGEDEKKNQLLELASLIKPLLEEIPKLRSVNYGREGSIPEEYGFLYSLDEQTVAELEALREDLSGLAGGSSVDQLLSSSGELYGDLVERLDDLQNDNELTEEQLSSLLDDLEERNRLVLSGLESRNELASWENRAGNLRYDLREVRNQREKELSQPFFSEDGSMLLMRALPHDPGSYDVELSQELTEAVQEVISGVKTSDLYQEGNYSIGLTGSFVTNSQRNSALRGDMLRTSLISSVAIFLVFFFSLGSWFYSILIVFPLGVAVLLTLSWAKFSVGGFNLLTTFIPALVLGLSIDYGIHLLFRFSEERSRGSSVSRAIRETIQKKGKGTFIAALTTAVVFATLIFSRSQGLVELGIISSLGIMMSFLVYIFLLPALITTYQRWCKRRKNVKFFNFRVRLRGFIESILRFPKTVVVLTLIASIFALLGATQLNFQFASDDVSTEVESTRVQEAVAGKFDHSFFDLGPSFVFFSPSLEELNSLEDELKNLEMVRSVRSLRDFLPASVDKLDNLTEHGDSLAKLNATFQELEGVLEDRENNVGNLDSLIGDLSSAQLSLTLSSRSALAVQLNEVMDQLLDIRGNLLEIDRKKALETIHSLRAHLLYLEGGIADLSPLFQEGGKIEEALPEPLRGNFTSDQGEYVIFAGVEESIYESDNLNRFVDQASGFADGFFGFPMIQYQLENHIRRDFAVSTVLAALLIAVILSKGISSLKLSLLAVIPLVFGYLFMLGGMRFFGMDFNFINIIISPLLVGIGVDDGLHLVCRWLEDREGGSLKSSVLSSFSHTGLAVITTSITTAAVFGSLFIARTPGLRILGGTALLGISFAMILSLTLLPAALYLAFRQNEE